MCLPAESTSPSALSKGEGTLCCRVFTTPIRHCGLDPQSPANNAFSKEIPYQVRNDGAFSSGLLPASFLAVRNDATKKIRAESPKYFSVWQRHTNNNVNNLK